MKNDLHNLPEDIRLDLAVNDSLSFRHQLSQFMDRRGGIDEKRPQAWCEYGFPDELTFDKLYDAYSRGGVAHGAVNRVISKCWQSAPYIVEGEPEDNARPVTAFEGTFATFAKDTKLWSAIRKADLRRLVGRWSALLLRVSDNRSWDQPIVPGTRIVEIKPLWANAIKGNDIITDTGNPRYGWPAVWQYTARVNGKAQSAINIHPDRVIIVGDWQGESLSFLEPVYNNLVSLEKIEGGVGESFLKNAARQIAINYSQDAALESIARNYGVQPDALKEKLQAAVRNFNSAIDSALVTQNADVKTLGDTVPDPSAPYNINLSTIAAGLQIPVKVLVGMQTGERASQEDQKDFNQHCQSRRVNTLSEDITEILERLDSLQLIPELPDNFTVFWDELVASSRLEKLEAAEKMAVINERSLNIGDPIFSEAEIRETSGWT